MAEINLKALVGKFNSTCSQSFQNAAGLCYQRSNYNVEIEHWLMKLLESNQSDIHAILRFFEVDEGKLQAELTKSIDRFKRGNERPPAISLNVIDVARDAYLLASVEYGEATVRSGHILLALLSSDTIKPQVVSSAPEIDKVNPAILKSELEKICADTEEARQATSAPLSGTGGGATPGKPGKASKTPNLDQFTVDLTRRAKEGGIDPVLGRDDEVRQIVDILCRRRQNNPILTGEPGVGKTAVVEGFALRIAKGDVPPPLQDVSIRALDLALLQAGAGVKGEFENRLKGVIEEVKSSPRPIILFIDEAHTMIGAGGQAGQGDAANLLKPALARGELRTIAATTWAEYKKYFERDAALARRFQVVKVEEPDEAKAIGMMRGLVDTLEKHHKVRILNEAVEDAVKLSNRYIAGRQLPDKSVSLLDTTCARINLSQNSSPPEVEHAERAIEQLKTATEILERESVAGPDHSERLAEIAEEQKKTEEKLAALTTRWNSEKELVTKILELHRQLHGDPNATAEKKEEGAEEASDAKAAAVALDEAQKNELEQQIVTLEKELKELQGENPLVHLHCDAIAVAETVGAWTGIPVGRMVADEIKTILELKQRMEEQVVGQSHALDQIAQSIRTSRAKLTDPNRPIGVFMLAGTSGVGKTETAITLAELLYGGEQNMTVINMSEFKEEHKVSLLMGSPPGYVGYGEGGVLTEAVRRKPYSVVLLDEMEKAHPGVQDIFYQVFDKGHMKDSEGRDIDFKNTVIIMTTNAGTDFIKSLCADPDTLPDAEGFSEAVYPELLKTFKPAFLGRITILPYYPLADDVMKKIIRLKLKKVQRRIRDNYKADMDYTEGLVDAIAARCTEVDTGARNVDKILNRTLLPEMSAEFLEFMAEGKDVTKLTVDVDDESNFTYQLG